MTRPVARRRSRSDADLSFVISMDLGFVRDFTVLALFEREFFEEPVGSQRVEYHITRLKRFELCTEAPEIIDYLSEFMAWRVLQDSCRLVVDATGAGLPLAQEMRRAGLRPIGLKITGGASVGAATVSKQALMSRLKV